MKKLLKSLDKKEIKVLILVTIVGLVLRCLWLNGKSGDYLGFLKIWVDNIRDLGYFKALKYNLGDYNIPYMVILIFISFIKGAPLYPIKIVSIIFDFICAIYSAKLVYKLTNKKIPALVTYGVLLFIPTMMVNGAMWAQCDSIYTAFILMSLDYLIDKKYIKSFIFLGISFAFKLQFIFVLPLYVLMLFREKKVHLYHFLIIPLVNIIMCLPAVIAGRDFWDIMLIYFRQTGTYDDLVLNFPNLYNFLQTDIDFFIKYSELVSKIGILVTLSIFACIWLYTLIKKVKFTSEKIITVALWSIVICNFFLPHMHDRYMFVADVLSISWFFIYQKRFHTMVAINVMSFLTYFRFLFGIEILDFKILSLIFFGFIIDFTIYTMKLLGENNEDGELEQKRV